MKKTFIAAALTALMVLPAWAQPKAPGTDYPNKPVRVIVAFAAGGNADINARLISTALSQQLGQQFVVENRPSGGGTVAFETIAQTPPDGYTLLVGALGSHTLNVGLYGDRLRIHPLTGVDHITITSHSPIVLATHPSMNVRTLAEFRAAVAAGGGNVLYGSSGNGTAPHLSGELFNLMSGAKLVHVPYKGSPQAVTDLLAGRVQVMFSPASSVLQHIKTGSLRALASTGLTRTAAAADLPTVSESGLNGFESSVWFGLMAPQATPQDIVLKLNRELQRALASAELKAQFAGQGIDAMPGTPEQFAAWVRQETAKWARVIQASGAKVD
ncbi:MAG: tripartite tricarboxylate transporter substrate binding protein [Acetobacteraceae bacterium]|nr:tripartite tricarboxylate transporter substrate binding protein [Acetobacteraceae bacterium]